VPQVRDQAQRLGILVPYRARPEHLPVFLTYMTAYMARHGLPYRLYVVEQLGALPFNRGWLLNHGFLAAENETDYVVTHDVDMLPLGADYRYPSQSQEGVGFAHMATEASQFDGGLAYDRYCGGVFKMTNTLFRAINGYSNSAWPPLSSHPTNVGHVRWCGGYERETSKKCQRTRCGVCARPGSVCWWRCGRCVRARGMSRVLGCWLVQPMPAAGMAPVRR